MAVLSDQERHPSMPTELRIWKNLVSIPELDRIRLPTRADNLFWFVVLQ
jgi:hypothetical protein